MGVFVHDHIILNYFIKSEQNASKYFSSSHYFVTISNNNKMAKEIQELERWLSGSEYLLFL